MAAAAPVSGTVMLNGPEDRVIGFFAARMASML